MDRGVDQDGTNRVRAGSSLLPGASVPVDLARLDFGRDDAESDLASGLLLKGFVPTNAYRAAAEGRKSLIIGRKGAGKSAICQLLASGHDPSVVVGLITPDDAAGEEVRRFELAGLNPETAKSLVWRYVFAMQICRYLVAHARRRHRRRLRRAPASVRRLRRFLRAHQEGDDERLYDRVLAGTRRLRAASFALGALGINSAVEFREASPGARAARQIDVLEAAIGRAVADLACAGRHPTLVIAVDQVEQIWSNDPSSDAMVIGLLLASKHVLSVFDGAIRCVLFLRTDIYDSLQFADSDKFRGEEERIDWTPELLTEVLLRRAAASVGRPVPPEWLWGGVLPAAVDGEPITEYLTSRTLLRPRDVIQFVTACRDSALRHGRDRITEPDVRAATRDFSRWKLQDLGNEYLVNYPFLPRLYPMFQNTGYVVTREEAHRRFAEIRDLLAAQFPEYAHVLEPDGMIHILFRIGFLGVRRGSAVVYGGTSREVVQPHESEFYIHPCFRAGLNASAPALTVTGVAIQHSSVIGQYNYGAVAVGLTPGTRPGPNHAIREAVRVAGQEVRLALRRSELAPAKAEIIAGSVAEWESFLQWVDSLPADAAFGIEPWMVGARQTARGLEEAARLLTILGDEAWDDATDQLAATFVAVARTLHQAVDNSR